jgi:hypothetical protein
MKPYLMIMKEYDGALNFATDAWTSPNHQAYIAITVHLEQDGKPISLLLDIVEVAQVSYSPIHLLHDSLICILSSEVAFQTRPSGSIRKIPKQLWNQ